MHTSLKVSWSHTLWVSLGKQSFFYAFLWDIGTLESYLMGTNEVYGFMFVQIYLPTS